MIELPTECPTCHEGYVRPTEKRDGHIVCRDCREKKAKQIADAKTADAIHRGFKL